MAEEMVRRFLAKKKQKELITRSTQTGDPYEFMVYLDKTKTMRMYFSESYKDYVLCLHFSNNKKYIITKPMWKKFRNHFAQIDYVLNREPII